MTLPPLNDLFRIAPGPMSVLLFLRVALAVGLPLVGFTLAGQPLAGVIAGVTAMLVSLCDMGITRHGRLGMMLFGLVSIVLCGVAGARFGGSTRIDEGLVIAAGFVAAWVSNSQPGLAAVARFGAVALVAGVGMQITDPRAVGAMGLGGASAIVSAGVIWWLGGIAPDQDAMDWRAGLRRALAGTDAGLRFAICKALMAALALFAAGELGLTRPYWAALVVVMLMRREGLLSLTLTLQYMAGTLVGLPLAAGLWHVAGTPWLIALLAATAAACARLGLALNPALGFSCFTIFLMLAIDLAQPHHGSPLPLLTARLYDVGMGCVLVIVGTVLAGAWQRSAARQR